MIMVPLSNITATPQTGYYFSGWTGEGIADATSTSTTVSMTEARTISASFTPKNFSLFAVVTPDDAGQVTGTGTYQFGEEANLTAATTMNGYSFLSWSGDINSTQNPLILNIDSNLSLTANFILNTYSLEITAGNGGSVSGDGNFSYGSLASISATPDPGYSFAGWSGSGVTDPNSPSTTVLIDQERSVSATFSINQYTLHVLAGSGGQVSGDGNFSYGSLASISATPDPGYSFVGWSGSGVTDPNSPSTTVLIDQERSVSATFSTNQYTLHVLAGSGGQVSGDGNFSYGSLASISATPDPGYSFAGWSGSGVTDPNSPSTTVLIDQERSVSATFSINQYTLHVLAGSGGQVSGDGNFSYGSLASISATPDPGYSFAGWSGSGVTDPNSPSTTVLIDQERSVSATFSINQYTLHVLAGSGGQVSGDGNFSYGSLASISATPDPGYSFAGWSGSGVTDPNSPSTTVLIDQERSVSATFSINQYTLHVLAGSGGQVSGDGNFSYGSLASISAIPDPGYSFAGWSGSGVTDPNSPSTTVLIDQERSVSATFSINQYTLHVLAGSGGQVSGDGNFSYGSLASISATPDPGYSFVGWSGSGVTDPNSPSTTVLIDQERSVSATFSINQYTLHVLAGSGGQVSGDGNFSYGSLASISATPDPGYSFVGWSGAGVTDPNSPSTTVLIDQERSVSATFSINQYTLHVLAGSGGQVSGDGNFSYGSLASISATPDPGYSFAGWSGSGVTDPNSPSTTVLIDQERSVSATFSINQYTLHLLAGSGGQVSGDGNFSYGSLASISATPDPGYSFAGWSGPGVTNPNSPSTTVLIDQERSVSATFSINQYTLHLLAGSGGQVSGDGNFSYGSLASISATPDPGYSFAGWSGSGVTDPNSPSTTVLIDQERSVSATFSINQYTLHLLAGSGGQVSGDGYFSYGSLASISATPDPGYSFAGWSGSGVTDPNSPSTTVLIDQERSVSANLFHQPVHTASSRRFRRAGFRRWLFLIRFPCIHFRNS